MDVVTDWPDVPFDDNGERMPFSEADITRLVPLMAHDYAPRRFALCEVVRDESGRPWDVSVIGWGLQVGLTDDSVAVVGYPDDSGRAVRGEFRSADMAARILGGADDVRLVWVDEEDTED